MAEFRNLVIGIIVISKLGHFDLTEEHMKIMRTSSFQLAAGILLASLFAPQTGNATTIASWTDSSLNPGGAASITATVGTGTISRGSALTYSSATNAYSSSGWTVGAELAAPTFGNQYVDIAVNTTGFTGVILNYSDQRSGTGPTTTSLYYSSAGPGGPFTLAQTNFPASGLLTARVVNLTGVTALNNNANVVFRLDGYGATAGTGTCRITAVSVTDAGGPSAPPSINGPTCAQVKAAVDGTICLNTSGTVTSVGGATGRLQFTIQDASGGVLVDKNTTTYVQPNVGDKVTITSGTKTTFNGTVELQPISNTDVVVTPGSNPQPAPIVFGSVAAFKAAPTLTVQATRVTIQNVYLTTGTTGIGTTTWLNPTTTGSVNVTMSDSSGTTFTARLTNDLHGKESNWQAKTRPVANNTSDRVDIIAVGALQSLGGPNEVSLNDPVGTSAKTDVGGPIAPATVPAAVNKWELFR